MVEEDGCVSRQGIGCAWRIVGPVCLSCMPHDARMASFDAPMHGLFSLEQSLATEGIRRLLYPFFQGKQRVYRGHEAERTVPNSLSETYVAGHATGPKRQHGR